MYDLLVPLGAMAIAPVYLARSVAHPDQLTHLAERFGALPEELTQHLEGLRRRPVWIQAVSVGEVNVARTLLEDLARARDGLGGSIPCVLSSTTPAGRAAASALDVPGLHGVFHFPIDWFPFVNRTLRALRPAALVCVETEIWPGLFARCASDGVPVLIVNGRISQRSERLYRGLGRMLRDPLRAVRLACMRSEQDARRAGAIGIPADRIVVTGDMKFDAPAPENWEAGMRALYGLPRPSPPVLVAGSTSPGEEEAVLDAWSGSGRADLVLILAPRHRERFEEVARLLAARGVGFLRRSRMSSERKELPGARVILLDTIGELARVYSLATVAFVGGSLVPRGGQNLIEPAACGVPVLFGPHTRNVADVAREMVASGAGFRVTGARDFAEALRRLLADEARRLEAGAAGRALVESHRGAAQRTLSRILPYVT